ncbi:MAG: DUF3857 domain-containing protein [Acidobacteria bacterium]|nr:MAG: DUF3857 domain-containing protein [Acidobacteriota bacterium]
MYTHRMRYVVAIVSLLAVAGLAQVPRSAAGSAAASKQQAFVIQQLITQVAFRDDGTGGRTTQATLTVDSDAGVKALAVLSFPYTQGYQTVKVDSVRVRQADGTVVTTPAENVRDMPAEISRVAPMYSDLMVKQVVVRGLQVGSTLEYRVESKRVKALVPGQFWFAYNFARAVVCKQEQLTLSVPADRAVLVDSPGFTPTVTEAGGQRVYAWQTSNAAPAKANLAELPPPPAVEATTFASWAAVGAWYNQLQQPELKLTPAIRAKAAALTRGLNNDDVKIQAIYAYVAGQIHYVSLDFGIGRYQPHAADDVLANGYGDCKDKHTLLAALLRAAGYDARPVLVNTARRIDPKIPSPAQFDHVITAVQRPGGLEWLDSTAGVAPAGWLETQLRGQKGLLIGSQPIQLVTMPSVSPVASTADFVMTGALSAQGTLKAHVTYRLKGDADVLTRAAFLNAAPARWQNMMQYIVRFLGFGGTVSNVVTNAAGDIEKPLVITYDYERDNFGSWSTQQITPPLPVMLLPQWNDQDQPTMTSGPRQSTARCTITLPAGYGITPTPDVHAKADFATYRSSYSFQQGTYTAERTLDVLTRTVPAPDKAHYLAFNKTVQGDVDAWTTVDLPAGAMTAAQQSQALTSKGWAQYERHQYEAAARTLQAAVQINPNNNWAWNDLGDAEMSLRQMAAAAKAFRKAIAVDANDPYAYDNLARIFWNQGNLEQAEAQLRKQIAVNPNGPYAAADLGGLLLQEKNYAAAVAELEKARGIADSARIEVNLGEADFAVHDEKRAEAAWNKAMGLQPSPLVENNVAWQLADAGLALAQAKKYGRAAVAGLGTEVAAMKLQNFTQTQAAAVHLLADTWDTLGWIEYKQGDSSGAVSYLAAAWRLAGDPVIGDHLGQVYEKQGQKQKAEQMYAEAGAAAPASFRHPRRRLRALLGSDAAAEDLVHEHFGDRSQQRSVSIPRLAPGSINASLLLRFSPGPGGKPKLDEAIEASGDPLPRNWTQRLTGVSFPVLFPDGSSTQLIEGAEVACNASAPDCDLVLMLPQPASFNP